MTPLPASTSATESVAAETVHWRRPQLRGVGCEFYFAANGERMDGSAGDTETVDYLQSVFEQHTGCTLPEPEIKPARGGPRV